MYEKNIGYPINDVSADYLKKINYVPAVPENLFETWLLYLSLQQPAADMYKVIWQQ